jgi:hypothetical protein
MSRSEFQHRELHENAEGRPNPNRRSYRDRKENEEPFKKLWLPVGAGGGSRTHTALRPADFESAASAIPPLRLRKSNSISVNNLLQHWLLHSDMRESAGVGSGVSWLPYRGVQLLDSGLGVLWCQVRVAYRHGDGLVAH